MAETIDQQFIEYIVKALVGNPDGVRVERTIDEKGVLLELYVDQEDLGRVIGRNGATAKSIRILLRALGVKNDARYNLKIVDTNPEGRPPRRDDNRDQSQDQPVAEGSDSPASEPQDQPAPTDEPAVSAEPEAPVEESAPEPEPTPEDVVSRSRKDLDDLTDLDI